MLEGSSKLTQTQFLPASNNNTTDSDKAFQSYILNNGSSNDENLMLNTKSTSIDKVETSSFNNYRSTLQINNLTVDSSNDLSLLNNIHADDSVNSAHSSEIIDDDEKTTEAIISLAMKIQQTNFNFVDDFEADEINVSNVCNTNEIQTSRCLLEQNGDQNTDPLKLDEDYKIHNSLKLLESLVNIEHDKLDVQNIFATENEIQPNIETNDKMQFKSSKKTNIIKKKSQKLTKNIHEEEEDKEEWLPSSYKQNRSSKNKTKKTNKTKSRVGKASKKNKKVEVQNTLNNLFTSNLSYSPEIQNDDDIALALNGSLFSNSTKKPETIVSTVQITKSLDTASSVGTQLAYHNTKDCLLTNEFKQFQDNIESMLRDKKKSDRAVAVNNSNPLLIKTCTVASTSGSNVKNENIKNKSSSGLSGSVMKTSDYKKLYEKDRKSLFSPDVILKSILKKPKNPSNDLHLKKEDQYTKLKCRIHKEESDETSNKKIKLCKPEITDGSPKIKHNSKSELNNVLTSLEEKYSDLPYDKGWRKCTVTSYGRLSKIDRVKTYIYNPNDPKCNPFGISKNKVSDNIDTSELQEDRTNLLENNEFGEGTSRQQQLNGVNVLENKESKKDPLGFENMPEWLRKKCELYNIKPLFVVINPYTTY